MTGHGLCPRDTNAVSVPKMQSKRVHPYICVHLSVSDLPGPFIVGREVGILEALSAYDNWSYISQPQWAGFSQLLTCGYFLRQLLEG